MVKLALVLIASLALCCRAKAAEPPKFKVVVDRCNPRQKATEIEYKPYSPRTGTVCTSESCRANRGKGQCQCEGLYGERGCYCGSDSVGSLPPATSSSQEAVTYKTVNGVTYQCSSGSCSVVSAQSAVPAQRQRLFGRWR